MSQPEFNEYARLKSLWVMVLKIAVDDVINSTTIKRSTRLLYADKAINWIWRTDRDASKPGSFCWVCSILDLDPDWVRNFIKQKLHAKNRVYTLERIKGIYGG